MSDDTKNDPLEGPLFDLSKAIKKVMAKFEKDDGLALFVIGVEFDETVEGEPTVNTFLAGSGTHNLLAEGLYGELRDQIEGGNKALFYLLTEVLQDIMEDLDLDPDPEPGEDVGPTFH